MKTFRTAVLAAIAALPLLAGAASAHGGWDGGGYRHGHAPPPPAHWWREQEARRARFEAEQARELAWRREAWARQRFAPPRPYDGPGGRGPRW